MPPVNVFDAPRVDFNKNDFDLLVEQKSRKVLYEKALQCPCKSRGSDALTTCRNCGGVGWIFINPKEVRMVIQGMSIATTFKAWSEEERGMIAVTTIEDNKISYMDRVTILDSLSVFNEVLHFKYKQGTDKYFAYSTYKIDEIEIAALFINGDQVLEQATDQDIYFEENKLYIRNELIESITDGEDVSITIRYLHHPAYHILESKRDTMDTFVVEGAGKESLKKLPIAAFARRAHYIADMQNLTNTSLLKNSFTENDALQQSNDPNGQVFNAPFNKQFQ